MEITLFGVGSMVPTLPEVWVESIH